MIKKAIVSGTYHFHKGLFYGGTKLEKNHEIVVN